MSNAPLRRTRGEWAVLALCVLAFGFWAMSQGQSSNWDLRNYHWYNGWAWLQQRQFQDIAVAQAQTWFNPILPAALYLLLSALKPWAGTLVLGLVQGLNILPLHRIALQLLPLAQLQRRRWLALLVAVAGATGATQRGELGTTFGDNLVSLPLLTAMALLLVRQPQQHWREALAGALLGLAVGLKLTAAPIAAGIAVASILLPGSQRERMQRSALIAATAAVCFALVNGPWMWSLYRHYGNPLFPLFGQLFGGDFVPPGELRDTRWLPQGMPQHLFYPLIWLDTPRRVSELWFLDLRVPMLFLLVCCTPLWWHRARAGSPQPAALPFLLLCVALIYCAWLLLFGYYRYLLVLEMLAPLFLAIALGSTPSRRLAVALCTALVAITLATRPPRWSRAPHYGQQYVEVQLPPISALDQALVVFADSEPLGFLAPSFPPGARFARIAGNLMGPDMPEWALDREVRRRLHEHAGLLYLVASDPDSAALQRALQRHGLALQRDTCATIDSNLFRRNEQRPQLCRAEKLPPP